MSNHRHKRHRSRSPINKRESQPNRNKDHDRRFDSHERHHHSSKSFLL